MRFERGKSVRESMEIGVMSKLEKYGPDILAKYHAFNMSYDDIKQMEQEFEKVLGFPVEVCHRIKDDNQSSITVKIKK